MRFNEKGFVNNHFFTYFAALFCIFLQAALTVGFKFVSLQTEYDSSPDVKYLVFGIFFCLMCGYAVLWQFVLRSVELSVANSMMSMCPGLTLFGGVLFFNESISIYNVIGITFVVMGLLFIGLSKKRILGQ